MFPYKFELTVMLLFLSVIPTPLSMFPDVKLFAAHSPMAP